MILLISPKNKYATNRILEEAANSGVLLAHFDVKDLAARNFDVDATKYDALYIRFPYPYFAQIIELANKFQRAGKKVIDASIARGDVGLGKMKSYERLGQSGIAIPKTCWLKDAEFAYPYIIKWNYGFKGKDVFLVKNDQDRSRITEVYDPAELLAQEHIAAEHEYKIITVGYRSLPVMLRFKVSDVGFKMDMQSAEVIDVSWCHPGSMEMADDGGYPGSSVVSLREGVHPTTKQSMLHGIAASPVNPPVGGPAPRNGTLNGLVSLAESAALATGRELSKVDILESNGKFYVLEVNRWPGFESFEKLSGCNVAKAFVEYLEL